ncbi:MAG: FUSC family protein [Eubacteriales bacterium]|nr:FUSC family protein [Eubacteriales bacterium]
MEKKTMEVQKASLTGLDLRMAVSVLLCVLSATILNHLGLKFPVGEMRLEIIQKMTAAICCMLCCQESVFVSRRAGSNRLIITAVGGLVGIAVILLDEMIGNEWVLCAMIGLGIAATLYFCKLCKVPYINARIGGVTFILVTCTLSGNARIYYAVFRFVSTFYGVLVVMLVTWIFQKCGWMGEKTGTTG